MIKGINQGEQPNITLQQLYGQKKKAARGPQRRRLGGHKEGG